MNPLFEAIIKGGFLVDSLGVVGLGLIGVAAVRLAGKERSWGGTTMALGAIGLIIARLIVLFRPHLAAAGIFEMLGDASTRMVFVLPTFLLTLGLAGVVWGLWAHDKWLKDGAKN